MPTQRSNGRLYFKRTLPGIGKVYKSLQTTSMRVARRREDALLSLHQQGRHGVVKAFDAGEVSIQEIQEAYENGAIHELAAEIRRGDASLGEACEAALRDKAPDVKDSTHTRYTTGLGHFRDFCGDDASVRESLSTDRLQEFKAHRLEEGAAKETVNNDLGAVSILATYALRQGWLDERPQIKRFSSKVRIHYLDPDQLTAYLDALRPAFRPLFQLLVGTGMRLGEAEALRVADLRLGNGEAAALVADAKTDSGVRTVFIPAWAAGTLQEHLEREELSGRDRVFQAARRTVQKEHNRACESAGIHDYTIHDHRHTAAVHLARAGMPLHLLQQQLGHANIDQTMRYARFHPEYTDVGAYFDRVGERFGLGGAEADEEGTSRIEQAAELLGVEARRLSGFLAELNVYAGNSSGNTPTEAPSAGADPKTS